MLFLYCVYDSLLIHNIITIRRARLISLVLYVMNLKSLKNKKNLLCNGSVIICNGWIVTQNAFFLSKKLQRSLFDCDDPSKLYQ